MQTTIPVCRSTIAVLLAILWSASALAGEDDLITPNVSAGYSYDSNVFRIASDRNPTGRNHRDDFLWFANVGVELNKTFGRQRVFGNVATKHAEYQDFTFLNNDSYDGALGYRLGFGSDSEVGFFYSRSSQLGDYADRVGFYKRNMVSSERFGGDVLLRVAGDWVSIASLTQGNDDNSAEEMQSGNSDTRAAAAGVRYAPRGSKNYIEARYRESDVDYDTSNYGYKQSEARLSATWAPNQISSLEAGGAFVRSRHDTLSHRDFSGMTGYVGVVWRPTGASTTTLRLARDVGSSGDTWGSYSRTNSITIKETWQATAKLVFGIDLAAHRRAYAGYQTFGAILADSTERRDRIYAAGLSASYAVTDKFQTSLSVRNERRLSNIDGYSYTGTNAMLTAQYKF